MKTTFVHRFLALAMVAGVLSTSFALPAKDGWAKVRMQVGQNQLLDRNGPASKAHTLVAAAQHASNGSGMIALMSVADGSARVFETAPSTDSDNVSRVPASEGIPYTVWCMVHPRWCWLGDNL